ncbi:MAG: hypothetical protein IK088_00455 [Lachnospiraceae bacterium]|nr:hypothetical protein [Lachnospiraceae bacterium]
MRNKTAFKSILCILLLFALVMSACNGGDDDPAASSEPSGNGNDDKGISVSFVPAADEKGMASVNYEKVSNLTCEYVSEESGYIFVNAVDEHIEIGGIENPLDNGGEYYRMDAFSKGEYAAESENVATLANHTSGATVRFATNASEIVLKVEMRNADTNSRNMTARGEYGFDVYTGSGTSRVYCGESMQMMFDRNKLNETIQLPGGYTEVLINLPLYAGVKSIEIGFPKTAEIGAPAARYHDPICFYGSSITQGCSASRPGTAYPNMVTRMLNTDCKNLGFSSSARGEKFVAEYIAGLKMSALVIDYDHNSSLSELTERHYEFYQTVRKAQPDLPIILVSKPCYLEEPTSDMNARRAVIEGTYKKAKEAGDNNIYFINGSEFFPKGLRELCTIDATHPNDLGMYYMGLAVYDVLNGILNK